MRSTRAPEASIETLDLTGRWSFRRERARQWMRARAPGCVHADLLAARAIPDPFYRDNERHVQWVEDCDWQYRREFNVHRRFLEHERVLLQCDGLDTLATVRLNRTLLGSTDNMFRQWEWDVTRQVRPGCNVLDVRFASTIAWIMERQQQRFLYAPKVKDFDVVSQGYIRKMQSNYGWDWAPRLVTCGIWRPVRLVAFSAARISDCAVSQRHGRGIARVDLRVLAERTGRQRLAVEATLRWGEETVAGAITRCTGGVAHCSLAVTNPALWWPAGMGGQPLYGLTVRLLDSSGRELDRRAIRIGLRDLRLVRKKDRWGESFHFSANGVPFFAKGANWVPAHAFPTEADPERYQRLLRDAAAANFNMLRVWGGGIYEPDLFYDLCDELGLCVWQDLQVACCHIPLGDRSFTDNFAAEVAQQVRRLRHHACLALWCGNNEFEMYGVGWHGQPGRMDPAQYQALFDRRLPSLVRRLDPDRAWWPCSPHSPYGDREDHNNPAWGDAHLWEVWGHDAPVEKYLECTHRFVSEFGFQSFPSPATIEAFTAPADRSAASPVMLQHQRCEGGNERIVKHAGLWFRPPGDFEGLVWQSQILQAMAIQLGVEHWRRLMPRVMGAIFWQYNDCWPVVSWSSLDFDGRWKALHYAARRFFAPVLLSAVVRPDGRTVDVYVVNERNETLRAGLGWRLWSVAGRGIGRGLRTVRVPARRSHRVDTLDCGELLARCPAAHAVLFLDLRLGSRTIAATAVTFVRPRDLALEHPHVELQTFPAPAGLRVRLTTDRPALWAWLTVGGVDARFSDNFFHLEPGHAAETLVTLPLGISREQARRRLQVRSLISTYGE